MRWRYGEAKKLEEEENERTTASEVEELAALSICKNRKALRGLPAIVSTVYQMAFQAGRSLKEEKSRPNKPNKQESK